ncbi:MAG: hypothetical protein AAFO93_04125 [Pseudomonadota bacterium]
MIPVLLTFGVPVLIAALMGARARRDNPTVLREFGLGLLWAVLFGTIYVFAWHVVWLAALSQAAGATDGLVGGALLQTSVSAPLWFPILVIVYVYFAQRARARRETGS